MRGGPGSWRKRGDAPREHGGSVQSAAGEAELPVWRASSFWREAAGVGAAEADGEPGP